MLTCSCAERCQVVCHLHTGRSGLSCLFFLHRPAQKLPTQHSWTFKTLLNGLIQSGAPTRTNTFIHGVPKMQMKHRPDTFTGLPLLWVCVRQQWGCHLHEVMQGTAPVFPPKSYLESLESPQDFLAPNHCTDVTDWGKTGSKQVRNRSWSGHELYLWPFMLK